MVQNWEDNQIDNWADTESADRKIAEAHGAEILHGNDAEWRAHPIQLEARLSTVEMKLDHLAAILTSLLDNVTKLLTGNGD